MSASVQAITAIKGGSSSGSSAVQSDYQVHQLESQIKDWSSCPTTPAPIKKQIVAKLQLQLDSLESGLENRAKTVQAQHQTDGTNLTSQTPSTQTTGTQAPGAQQEGTQPSSQFVSPFRVDTYA